MVPRRIPPTNVIQFVYRYGTHAFEDWAAKLQSVVIPSATRGDAVATLSLSVRLKGDFLNRVAMPGHIYSLLEVDDTTVALADVSFGTRVKAGQPFYSRALHVLLFEVVEGRLRRRNVALTDRTRARQGM